MKIRKKECFSYELYEILLENISIINKSKKKQLLKTLWDAIGVAPAKTHCEFQIPPKTISQKRRNKIAVLWKKYQVGGDPGVLSLFSCSERIRMIKEIVNNAINPDFLVDSEILLAYFPINDFYELSGMSHSICFLPKSEEMEESKQNNVL